MTRAVIELEHDTTSVLPVLSRAIEGAGFNPEGDTLGFRFEDMSVLVERRKVTVYGAGDEATAERVMHWLVSRIDNQGQMGN